MWFSFIPTVCLVEVCKLHVLINEQNTGLKASKAKQYNIYDCVEKKILPRFPL